MDLHRAFKQYEDNLPVWNKHDNKLLIINKQHLKIEHSPYQI